MKLFSKLSALGAVLIMATAFASADAFYSSSATVSYDGYLGVGPYPTPADFTISPSASYDLAGVTPTWVAPITGSNWVGAYPNAGPGGVNPAKGYYLFSYTFQAGVSSLDALAVYADDTTSVWLYRSGIYTQVTMSGDLGSDAHCADNPPSCVSPKFGTLISPPYLVTGGDKLYFVVQQAGIQPGGGSGNPSGLDFGGSDGRGGSVVPEPSSLLMLGTGLVGSAGMMMRRMRAIRK